MLVSLRRSQSISSPIRTRFKERGLQSRFLRQWLVGWIALNTFLFIPLVYLIQQNYRIFMHLAHLQAPYLIEHLEREHAWTYGLLISTTVASFIWGLILAVRWSTRVFAPLTRLQEHLYHLSRGRWSIPPLSFDDPEIQSVANSYNYFYRSLQAMTRQQLDLIALIKVGLNDSDSKDAVDKIRGEASQRIHAEVAKTTNDDAQNKSDADSSHFQKVVVPINPSAGSAPSPSGRRAS